MSSTAPALRARVPRLAGAALERARLTVVPRRRRRRSSPVPFLLVVSMIAVGGIVGLLLFNTSMQQASFAATSLQNQADVLVARQQTLQMELDQLRDPQAVALKAQRMGMVLPISPAVLDLRTGHVLGTPTAATRLDPLRLLAPPPPKPASINPPAHVTVVHPPATHAHGGATAKRHAGSTAKRDHKRWAANGRHHGLHALHSTPSGNH